MTIEEAIYCLKTYDPESDHSACFKCPYYGSTKVSDNTYICKSNTARKMAIEALKKEKTRRNNKLVSIRDVELALLEKGQSSKRYRLGEIWELNFDEIREALETLAQSNEEKENE